VERWQKVLRRGILVGQADTEANQVNPPLPPPPPHTQAGQADTEANQVNLFLSFSLFSLCGQIDRPQPLRTLTHRTHTQRDDECASSFTRGTARIYTLFLNKLPFHQLHFD
jgi:hypothetical protein